MGNNGDKGDKVSQRQTHLVTHLSHSGYKTILFIIGCRCDERLKVKTDGSIRLVKTRVRTLPVQHIRFLMKK